MLVKRLFLLCLLIGFAQPADAQDTTRRDPLTLARQLLGFSGDAPIPPPVPDYQPGASETFWVDKTGQDAPTRITAELAAATRDIYLWVENGLEYDPTAMRDFAARLNGLLLMLSLKDNYGLVQVSPRSLSDFNVRSKLLMPDVDNDPHLSILYASNLRDISNILYNPNNSVEAALVPGGYSNQREMLVLNTSALPAVPLHDPAFSGIVARQMIAMLAYYNTPGQPNWLTEALSGSVLRQIQNAGLTSRDIAPFLEAPNTGLLQASSVEGVGARQLFLQYILQRFGAEVYLDLFNLPGDGLNPLDAALARHKVADLVTGETITAQGAFADFVMANVLNGLNVGDGRYQYRNVDFGSSQAAVVLLRDNLNATINDGTVSQLGTRYIVLTSATPTSVTVDFSGQPTVSHLPMPENSSRFYWSGGGLNQAASITRAFDLRNVKQATLTFDAWYSLAEGWNYAYVEVSTDEGKTWNILPASSMSGSNPNGVAYGPAFTGVSNPDGPRPFPYLGIGLDADGITITQIMPDGPLAGTDVQVGDTIAGYDGKTWVGRPNLIGWLATHEAGDSVKLYMKRGSSFFDVPVMLSEHPTRVFLPDALWLPQRVDLSAFAGQNILLRFQYISLPGRDNAGFAVDNIAIPEIGFSDDAEGAVPGWTLDGWQQTSNQLPQQFLVQAAQIGQDVRNVRRLIAPGDAATAGAWQFSLAADDVLILAISGLNDNTDQPARFALAIRGGTNPTPTPAAPSS